MNKIFQKAMVTLTAILVAFSLAASASAYAAGTSCTEGSSAANAYTVYSNTNSTCNIQGIDVNSLLGKLNSYGCPTKSADTAKTDNNSCTVNGCNVNGCAGDNCTTNSACKTNNCSVSNCATGNCASGSGSGCATTNCATAGNQTAVQSANSSGSSPTKAASAADVKGAAAKYVAGIKKLCQISYGTAVTTASPKPSASVTPTPSASPAPTSNSGSTSIDNGSFEQQVLALVNEQRAANGLSPLKLSTELSNVARTKSQDMSDNNYFSHTSPRYGSPFDMLKSFGISYRTAGENIAMGYATPQAVMNAWMNSAGHRANILNASYTQIGIGYVADGNYWTQEFIG